MIERQSVEMMDEKGGEKFAWGDPYPGIGRGVPLPPPRETLQPPPYRARSVFPSHGKAQTSLRIRWQSPTFPQIFC